MMARELLAAELGALGFHPGGQGRRQKVDALEKACPHGDQTLGLTPNDDLFGLTLLLSRNEEIFCGKIWIAGQVNAQTSQPCFIARCRDVSNMNLTVLKFF